MTTLLTPTASRGCGIPSHRLTRLSHRSGRMHRVEAYVAVTDGDWYRFLARRPDLDEVNFWRPGGGRGFHRIAIGEPFFFKTHHPHNRVVGGGFYSAFAPLQVSEAWDLFGDANGVQDLDQ